MKDKKEGKINHRKKNILIFLFMRIGNTTDKKEVIIYKN